MKGDKFYLVYLLECLERIKEFTAGGKDTFMSSHLIQDAVLRNLHTLTESTLRLSDGLKNIYPNVAWKEIAKFGNVVVHDYLGVNLDRVWKIVEIDLPVLAGQARSILDDLGGA
jgi:uncharacterized protein with HEPN domain